MRITRREALSVLGSALPLCGQSASPPKLPMVCVSSKALTGVGYAELGEIVKQIGFDGVDITVMPGGLVEPQSAPVDEVRALESIHGADLLAPIITTALATPYEPWSRTVLALAGRTGVGLFLCGINKRNSSLQSKREALGLANAGREYRIALTVAAAAYGTAFDIPSASSLIAGIDPEWAGFSLGAGCFHPDSGVTDAQVRAAMPRVKAITISDFSAGEMREARPLGKGSVDFARMFRLLAHAQFTGPLTVHRDYKTSDEPGSLSRDAEFLRKQIQVAYANLKS